MNVFWLNLTATTHVVADLKSVIDGMASAWATNFTQYQNNSSAQTGAKASWLYASGNVLEYTGAYSNAGTAGSGVETDSTCALINWTISDYYRGGHPRTYLGPLSTVSVNNGRTLYSTAQTNISTSAGNFLTAVNALTHGGISAVALGTVRFASGNAWLSPPVFRAYLSGAAAAVVGTQRRRLAR